MSKGQRTRQRLLVAARKIFERDGYFDARVADIAAEAGVGHGTFYTYFPSKDEVFIACAQEVTDSLYDVYQLTPGLDLVERIHQTNRRYVERYEENALMMGLLDQVAPTSDQLREMRMGIRRHFAERLEAAISRMNHLGRTAKPTLDPFAAAIALGSMVDHICYQWFVLKEPFDRDVMLRTFDLIWLRALGLGGEEIVERLFEGDESETGGQRRRPAEDN
jgi:AcrR family transcriptional regulator